VALKVDTVLVTCPSCGHKQPEPRSAYSGICKRCRGHFRLAEALDTTPKPPPLAFEQRRVACFECGAELEVSIAAESTMCKRCSSHVDLRDYQITQAISKSFRTHGRLVIEEKGYLLNTESVAGDAVIKGRLIGKLMAKRTLEIYSTAHIKGTFTAERLIVPAGNHFRWPEIVRVGGAEIGGELAAELESSGIIHLKSTARLFGNVLARHLIVESGAVLVGAARIGKLPALS
jgi:cytoskeletal protein CcmA (bactofilin family)/DNA-directed RNA polymerase subunit RPC12/RpoP